MKKVAFFDIDGTIYGKSVFIALAKHAIQSGWLTPGGWLKLLNPLEQTEYGKTMVRDNANSFLQEVAAQLKGKNFETICLGVKDFYLENKRNFYPYFEQVLPILKTSHDIYIVTTNAQFAAKALVDTFNLTGFISSEFEVTNGLFTGVVSKSLANGKYEVSELLKKYGKEGSIAVGDGENDISMLEQVDFPVCMNPTDALQKHAKEHEWVCTTGDTAESVFNSILTRVS